MMSGILFCFAREFGDALFRAFFFLRETREMCFNSAGLIQVEYSDIIRSYNKKWIQSKKKVSVGMTFSPEIIGKRLNKFHSIAYQRSY